MISYPPFENWHIFPKIAKIVYANVILVEAPTTP